VLQDLTFVHIGNPDTIEERINFAKRWQQFNILVSWIVVLRETGVA
jgi:Rap guanine nucleotide exchange factor 1